MVEDNKIKRRILTGKKKERKKKEREKKVEKKKIHKSKKEIKREQVTKNKRENRDRKHEQNEENNRSRTKYTTTGMKNERVDGQPRSAKLQRHDHQFISTSEKGKKEKGVGGER